MAIRPPPANTACDRSVHFGRPVDDPGTAARGTDRELHHRRKAVDRSQLAPAGHEAGRRLRQTEFGQDLAEARFAVGAFVALEARQRDLDVRKELLANSREQKSLLMGRQQHVETAGRNQLQDEGQVALRIGPEPRAAVKPPHEAGETAEAVRIGIADFEMVARKPQRRDRFARGGAPALGQKNAHACPSGKSQQGQLIAAAERCSLS
jgi:hypothetical protein